MQVHVREQACLHTQTHVTRRPRTHRHMHTRIRKTTAHTGTRDRRSDPLSSDRVGGQRQAQEVVPGRHRSPVCSWDVTVLRRELGEGECITVSPSHMREGISHPVRGSHCPRHRLLQAPPRDTHPCRGPCEWVCLLRVTEESRPHCPSREPGGSKSLTRSQSTKPSFMGNLLRG